MVMGLTTVVDMVIDATPAWSFLLRSIRQLANVTPIVIRPHQGNVRGNLQPVVKKV